MMGAGSVFAGTACAQLHGHAEFFPATLCLLFVIFAQLAGNFYYRYFNERELCLNPHPLVKAHIREDILPILKECSFAMLLVAITIGWALVAMGGWKALVVGAFILAVGWLTCAGKYPLLRTPFGVLCSFFMFGPVAVLTTGMFQLTHDSEPLLWDDMVPSFYMSAVVGLVCINATLLYSYATYNQDLLSGKDSFVTMYGRKTTRLFFLINGFLFAGLLIGSDIHMHLPRLGLALTVPAICLAVNLYIWKKMSATEDISYRRLINLGSFNVLLLGLLSLILSFVVGKPDDSQLTFFGISALL